MRKKATAEQQRRMIAESAYRVLARDGLEGLSMRKVAADAGCTIGLINHWFSSKEALVMTAWEAAIDREQRRGDALRNGDEFPIESALLSSLPTTRDLRRKELVWLAFRAMSVSNPKVRQAFARHYDYARRMLAAELVRRGVPRDQADEKGDLLLVVTDAVVSAAALEPGRWPAARQRTALLTLIESLLGRAIANDVTGTPVGPRLAGVDQRAGPVSRRRPQRLRTKAKRGAGDRRPAPAASVHGES